MQDAIAILQCPVTGRDLQLMPDGRLSVEGGPSYAVYDGVAAMLEPATGSVADGVREFYDTSGWVADDTGMFAETKAFSDTREQSREFTNRCIKRMGRYFNKGGKYILDAGSGPIPYDGYLKYGEKFEKRVCVDLSINGLHAAKKKLGDRGIYLQGDLTKLPLKSGSMDAITCNHVLYQLPPELQAPTLVEMWRVLKPGGVAVIVYLAGHSPLDWRFRRLAKLLFGEQPKRPAQAGGEGYELPHNPLPLSWFEEQKWPFTYKLDSFRPWTQGFMVECLPDDWRGRAFMNAFYLAQAMSPGYFARNGVVPTFVVRKPLNAG